MHQRLLSADHLAELVREPFAWVDGVQLDVTERVARNFLSVGLHLFDDRFNARAFGNEDIDGIKFVQNSPQALSLGGYVDFHLGNEHAVNFKTIAIQSDFRQPFRVSEQFVVFKSGRRREPAAVAPHHFVDDEHARIGIVLIHHIAEEKSALFGGSPSAKRLLDRVNVVVDGLGQADDRQTVIVLGQKRRQIGCSRVGIVATNGVKNIHSVFDQLVRRDLLRVLAFLDQAALDAVFYIGEFDPAVADGRTAKTME